MDSEKIKIFLVDDDKMFVNALKHSLSKEKQNKFDMHVFSNGEEFLKHFHHDPSIVILDYNLNNKSVDAMDGCEVLKRIKKSHPNTEVIVLSSQEDIEVAMSTLRFGAYDYVPKGKTALVKVRKLVASLAESMEFNYYIESENRLQKTVVISAMVGLIILFLFIKLINT